MASPGGELRRAMAEIQAEEEIEEDDLEDLTLLEQLRELYGSNAGIADAAGAPTAAAAEAAWRARHPKAPRGSANAKKIRETARRRRQSFLRNLQRYDDGTRRPKTTTSRLEELRDNKLEERLGAATLAGLAQIFADDGVTVRVEELTMNYDGRVRSRIPAVTFGGQARVALSQDFVDAVRSRDWSDAAAIFWAAHGTAYGAYLDPSDVSGLSLAIGSGATAYGFSRAAL